MSGDLVSSELVWFKGVFSSCEVRKERTLSKWLWSVS